MSGLNPALLQKGQNYVLFTAFWLIFTVSSLPLAPLSPGAGLVLFVVLDLLISIVLNRKRVRNTGTTGQMLLIAGVLLVFPLAALSGLLAVRFPFPYDLALLKVRFYLVYLIPALILARFFELAAARFSGSVFLLAPGNLLILSVIMSRSGWALRLPSESLWAAYLLIFLFLVFQSLLLLSGGRRGYRLSFLSAVLVLLIPLLGLVPLSRLQKDESRKEGGGLLESSLFRFDFSDYLSLESSISMKDDLVFLMKKEGVSLKGLTRRFVLSAYSPERGFYKDSDEALESPGVFQNEYVLPESPRSWGYPEFELTGEVIQEYYLVNFDSSAFLGFNSPVSVTPFESWDESSFSRIYSVTSQVSEAWGWDLVDSGALPEDSSENRAFLDYYTRIGEREDLVQLAEEITSESRTYYDHVADIEEYLQNNYYYSLTPGESPEGDQLSHFLYESKKGYCSYFAFSMALLCRSIGIPARVALGFWVDESSSVMNYYPVRANQAHAWVEVYFPRYGWVEFDPTSTTLAEGEEFAVSPVSAREMEPYLKEILENRDSLTVQAAADDPRSGSGQERNRGAAVLREGLLYFLPVLLLVLLSLLVRIGLLLYRVPRKGRSVRRYYHLHMLLPSAGFRPMGRMESPEEYAAFLHEELPGLGGFVTLYEKICFGRSSGDELLRLKESGDALRRSLFTCLSPAGKVRYILTLLSGLPAAGRGRRRFR